MTEKNVRQVQTAPPVYRIIGLSVWASLLALIGLAVAARAFAVTQFNPDVVWWFGPAAALAGMIGIGLTILALGAVRRRFLPWLLLPGASAALAVVLLLTRSAGTG